MNESTSLFHYDNGYSHQEFSHPDFVPFFIDEFSEEKRNASIDACGGASASQACIFDFLATGDRALAASSGSEQATSDTENAAAGILSFISEIFFSFLFVRFSTPEPKAQVKFSDQNVSFVRRPCRRRRCRRRPCRKLSTFSSSSPEPLGQSQSNLAQSILG